MNSSNDDKLMLLGHTQVWRSESMLQRLFNLLPRFRRKKKINTKRRDEVIEIAPVESTKKLPTPETVALSVGIVKFISGSGLARQVMNGELLRAADNNEDSALFIDSFQVLPPQTNVANVVRVRMTIMNICKFAKFSKEKMQKEIEKSRQMISDSELEKSIKEKAEQPCLRTKASKVIRLGIQRIKEGVTGGLAGLAVRALCNEHIGIGEKFEFEAEVKISEQDENLLIDVLSFIKYCESKDYEVGTEPNPEASTLEHLINLLHYIKLLPVRLPKSMFEEKKKLISQASQD